jgi:Pex19 protein family
MREMESSPSARNEFESLVKSMSDATPSATAGGEGGATFTDAISRTMERIQESETAAERARDEAASQGETDAFLADLLKQLDSVGGEGANEAGMAKMLEGMMEQLMNKEMLYEPMKELQEKVWPPWRSVLMASIHRGWNRTRRKSQRQSTKRTRRSTPTSKRFWANSMIQSTMMRIQRQRPS